MQTKGNEASHFQGWIQRRFFLSGVLIAILFAAILSYQVSLEKNRFLELARVQTASTARAVEVITDIAYRHGVNATETFIARMADASGTAGQDNVQLTLPSSPQDSNITGGLIELSINGPDAPDHATILAMAGLDFSDAARRREVLAAASLTSGAALVHRFDTSLQWSYYFSGQRDFIALYPHVPGKTLIELSGYSDGAAMLRSYFEYDLFKESTPERNPEGTFFWTRPYLDAGGTGTVVSAVTPLRIDGRYYGMVGTDIQIKTFEAALASQGIDQYENGLFLVAPDGEIVARSTSPSATATNAFVLSKLTDLLAPELRPLAPELVTVDGIRLMNGHQVIGMPIGHSNWRLLRIMADRQLTLRALKRFLPAFILAGTLLAVLLGLVYTLKSQILHPFTRLLEIIKAASRDRNIAFPSDIPALWAPSYALMNDVISRNHQYMQSIVDQATRDEAIINNALDCIVSVDRQGLIIHFNRAAEDTFGFRLEEVIGRPLAECIIPPAYRDAHNQGMARLLATNETRIIGRRIEVPGLRKSGEIFPLEMAITQIRWDGNLIFTAHMRDISERVRKSEEVERLAYSDQLTGLANRTRFNDLLDERVEGDVPTAIFVIEFNKFRELKSTLGHQYGDKVIVHFAAMLKERYPDHTIARTGNEQFALQVTGVRNREECQSFANDLVHCLTKPLEFEGRILSLAPSIGATLTRGRRSGGEDFLREAEISAYIEAEKRTQGVTFFDFAQLDQIAAAYDLEHDLRRALGQDTGLWVAYQPIVTLDTLELVGFEALVRWNHDNRGQLPPDVFLSVAEQTGLIHPLTKRVFEHVCQQIARWQKEGPLNSDFFVSVNLAASFFNNPTLFQEVSETIDLHGIDRRHIKVEITESAIMDQGDNIRAQLLTMKEMGIRVALDDFGTGYSSLSYLHHLPLDNLKIDRSFVVAMHRDRNAKEITRMVANLAHALNLTIIAEGIEDPEDISMLREFGCEYGQGYLFSRPLDADTFRLSDLRDKVSGLATTTGAGPTATAQE